MTAKTLIYETEHVAAVEQDLGGDDVVVIFNSAWQVRNGVQFSRDNLLLRHGISAIGIVTVAPNWYPPKATAEVLAAVRDRVGNRRVITYGHGQGGYGALKFAAAVRASGVVAFSPQWSIDPADVESFDTRFTRHFDPSLRNGTKIEEGEICAPALVFFDHIERKDARHAAKLAALKRVYTVANPFSEEETLRVLGGGLNSTALIRSFDSLTASSVTELRRLIRASRAGSASYLDCMMRRLVRGKRRSRRSLTLVMTVASETREVGLYSAVLAHIEGNADRALAHLQGATDKAFDNIDLLSWRRALGELEFLDAEMVLASKILKRQPNNIGACLQVIDTLIRARDIAAAVPELNRLAKFSDVKNHAALIAKQAVAVRSPQVLETLLAGELPQTVRIDVLFALADLHQQLRNRPGATQMLKELAGICLDFPANLRRLARAYLKLDETSFALEILQGLIRKSPEDCDLALDIVEARSSADKKRALSELNVTMARPGLPPEAWQRASHLYELLGKRDAALQMINKSIALGNSGPSARQRLAVLLDRTGRRRRARQELEVILTDARASSDRLRLSGDFAIELGDRQLAYRFAEAQFRRAPENPESIMYLARCARLKGDRDAAGDLVASLLEDKQKLRHLTGQQLVKLADELYKAGRFALAKHAVARVLEREPANSAANALVGTMEIARKLGLG